MSLPVRRSRLATSVVSRAADHADWKIINQIVTEISPPKRGTVTYTFVNGFDVPSSVKYTPFPGQSGIDTWTYQGTGALGSTTVRTATVSILNADGTQSTALDLNQHGLTGSWYEPATSGQGVEVEIFPDLATAGTGVAQVSWFTFDATTGGADRQRWYTLGGQDVEPDSRRSRSPSTATPAATSSRRRSPHRRGRGHREPELRYLRRQRLARLHLYRRLRPHRLRSRSPVSPRTSLATPAPRDRPTPTSPSPATGSIRPRPDRASPSK